ncbi:MAG: CPBP family intramembrane metalloprotease [Tissierellia bacterium]|nr:CPBP family intramembrane metalloprotease [Tissierellia bacterium]
MKKYLINTGIVLFFVAILALAPKTVPHHLPQDLVPSFQYLFPIGMVFVLAKLLHRTDFLRIKKKVSPFPLFYMVLIISALQFGLSYLSIEKKISPNLRAVVLMFLFTFLIALFEEFLFRGLLLDEDLHQHKDDQRIKRKLYFSSLLFALIHFYNLYLQPALVVETINQVIYAFFLGVYLSALLLKTKNIWWCVLAHMIVDLSAFLPTLFQENTLTKVTDMSISTAIINLIYCLPLLIAGIRTISREAPGFIHGHQEIKSR